MKLRVIPGYHFWLTTIVFFFLVTSKTYSQAITGIQLTSVCSENPGEQRVWRVKNENSFPVLIHYQVYPGGESGEILLPGSGAGQEKWTGEGSGHNYTFFSTRAVDGPNTVVITYGEGQQETKASSGDKCSGTPSYNCINPWELCGNAAMPHHQLGTLNGEDLRLVTNDQQRLVIDGGTGEVRVLENLLAEKNVSVNSLQVRSLGNSTGEQKFVTVDSTGKIDTASVPIKIKNDTLVIHNINVEKIKVKNHIQIGDQSIHLNSASFENPVTPSSNELYATGDLYIQSRPGNDFNTIINHGNNGLVGIGTFMQH